MATSLHRIKGEQFFDDNGDPLNGGKLYYYEANTTNLQDTFSASTGAPATNPNPLPLDASGRLQSSVFFGDSDSYSDYKELLTDANDVTITNWPVDNLPAAQPSASAAAFAPPLFPWTQVSSGASPVALTAADAGNAYEADTTAGNIEFDLPSAASVGDGKGFVFKKTAAANSMIIDPNGTETIDNSSTSLTITRENQVVAIFSNGAEWYVAWQYLDDVPIAVGAVNALVVTNNSGTPTTLLDIACSEAVLVHGTSNYAIRVGTQALTLNGATVGANGLDAGALAASTWYHVWLISNGTTTASLLSTSATAPTMPSGYIYKYRIGAVRTSAASQFLHILQRGKRSQYRVVTASNTPNMPIMASGVVGSVVTPTWVAVPLGNFIPPTAVEISFTIRSAGVAIVAPNNRYGAAASTTNPPYIRSEFSGSSALVVIEESNLYWANDTAAGYLACNGWIDAVNAN